MRNEKGLLVYDDEFRHRFMTSEEIALNDEWVKKHATLIKAKERGEISKQEYDRLVEELDAEHDDERRQLRNKKFAAADIDDEKFFVSPIFANA